MRISPATSVWFDALRVLSIFTVVIGHFIALLGLYEASGLPFPVQSYGVVVMFMLSGFLIMSSISAKTRGFTDFERYRFSDYLIDRGSRIFIVYWPVIAAILLINHWFAAHRGVTLHNSGIRASVVNALMLQLHPALPATWQPRIDTMSPVWALALEWWIYLAVGWLVLVVVARARRTPTGLATTTRVSPLALVILGVLSIYALSNLVSPGASALPWFAGAGLYFVHDKIPVTRRTRWAYLAASALLFVACIAFIALATDGYVVTGIYSTGSYLLSAGWFLFLVVFTRGCAEKPGVLVRLSGRVLRFLAGYMYSLFLTHFTVFYYVNWARWQFYTDLGPRARLVFLFVASNVVALIIGMLLERNGRALGTAIKRALRRTEPALR